MLTDHIEGCCEKIELNKDSDIEYQTFTKILKDEMKVEYGIVKGKIKTGYNKKIKSINAHFIQTDLIATSSSRIGLLFVVFYSPSMHEGVPAGRGS